ncbi:MAG: hypothetical protein HQK53_11840 [Oligoflexia bacterium]|nr:hypothetical protein [Oligoflexia bacterium]
MNLLIFTTVFTLTFFLVKIEPAFSSAAGESIDASEASVSDSSRLHNACLFDIIADTTATTLAPVERPFLSLCNLCNLFSQSALSGVLLNSNRNQLGTTYPCIPPYMAARAFTDRDNIDESERAEGPFFQALRIFTYFDWEFMRSINYDKFLRPLPRQAWMLAAPLSEGSVAVLPNGELNDESLNGLCTTISRVMSNPRVEKMLPDFSPFCLKNINLDQIQHNPQTKKIFLTHLQTGVIDYLRELQQITNPETVEDTTNTDASSSADRLRSMLKAYKPILTVAHFSLNQEKQGGFDLEMYLPPLYQLHTPNNTDDPANWYLEKGASHHPEASVLNISIVDLKHMNYLRDGANPNDLHLIKVNLHKNFEQPNQIGMIVSFGKLVVPSPVPNDLKDNNSSIFDLDCSKFEDALSLSGQFRLGQDADNYGLVEMLKKAFNKLFEGLILDVRIHKLVATLNSAGDTPGPFSTGVMPDDLWGDSNLPYPSSRPSEEELLLQQDKAPSPMAINIDFSESMLSFRVKKLTVSSTEMAIFKHIGLFCSESVSTPDSYDCYQDFATWKDFRSNFLNRLFNIYEGEDAEGLLGQLDSGLRSISATLIQAAAREIINYLMPEIESDIDKQINIGQGGIPTVAEDFLKTRARILNQINSLSSSKRAHLENRPRL